MITPQLIELVRKQLASGNTKDTITKQLIGAGWDQNDVQSVFVQVEKSAAMPSTSAMQPPAPSMSEPTAPAPVQPQVQQPVPPPPSAAPVPPPVPPPAPPSAPSAPPSAPPPPITLRPIAPAAQVPPTPQVTRPQVPPAPEVPDVGLARPMSAATPTPPVQTIPDVGLPRVISPAHPPVPSARMPASGPARPPMVQPKGKSHFWLGFFTAIGIELVAAGAMYAAVYMNLIQLNTSSVMGTNAPVVRTPPDMQPVAPAPTADVSTSSANFMNATSTVDNTTIASSSSSKPSSNSSSTTAK